jgi:sulfur-oxidizing protein SoxY
VTTGGVDRGRRAVTGGLAASAALLLAPLSFAAAQTPAEVEAALAAILAGREPQEQGIGIELPTLAENGAQVPVTVRVDSPMTADDHVTAIHLVATANPTPGIGTFRLTPRLGRAEVFTRIRLAEEQDVVAVAEMSDGRVLRTAARVFVSVGGCAT